MSLAARAVSEKAGSRGTQACTFVAAAQDLSPEEAEGMWALVFERLDLGVTQVARVLTEEGVPISSYAIYRHRNGDCQSCAREGRHVAQ